MGVSPDVTARVAAGAAFFPDLGCISTVLCLLPVPAAFLGMGCVAPVDAGGVADPTAARS